jgi:glyoxylase-like metal-dependent hydrolase (beta-lactamase superfamily II)
MTVMRVHYLNCGTDCPVGGPLFDGKSTGPLAHLSCAAQLIETDQGLVLVDTGYGVRDVRDPHPRLSRTFDALLNIRFRMEETALYQLKAMGFSPDDVRHIVLTHLDFDHAGGIEDFPRARVHVMERGLPPEILIIPLPGHTWGHAGVAVQQADGWVLNAGDAYFYRGEMDVARPHCTPGLRAYQKLMEVDRTNRLRNQDRLRDLKRSHGDNVRIFCSHDAVELAEMQKNGDAGPVQR